MSKSKPQYLKVVIEDKSSRKYPVKNSLMEHFQTPEFHIHFDVWGWRDSTGLFREGIPQILEKELEGIVHIDSFNPFYNVLTKDGKIPASKHYRETPYLLTSGLSSENMQVSPTEARRAKIGFDELNRRIGEINQKHNIELVGYTELELIPLVAKLPNKPYDAKFYQEFFIPENGYDKSAITLVSEDLTSGFKSCEFHFKLGKGYDPRVLKYLISIGLINAAMPANESGEFTPYFTLQARNVEVRNQLAAFIGLLAHRGGGFGDGAKIQIETIVAHQFFGEEFAPETHLPKIVTGLKIDQNIRLAKQLEKWLASPANQATVAGRGKVISEVVEASGINESYKAALQSLRDNPPDEEEIKRTLAMLNAWDDNPDLLTNEKPKTAERGSR